MKSTRLLLAPLLLAAAGLGAQTPVDARQLPACAEGGVSRVAVTVPHGQTREQLVQSLQDGGAFAPGTQVKILARHERPRLSNPERFESRWAMHMRRFLRSGLEVDGATETLLEVDADGVVTAVHPNSGHRDVDRGLRDLWRHARYEPVVAGACRVPAWLHVGMGFESEFQHERREIDTRVNP